MNNSELAYEAYAVSQTATIYAKGLWGQEITKGVIASKQKQYPEWYTDAKVKKYFEPIYGKGVKGFDCVCFIKKICFWKDKYKSEYDWTTSKLVAHCAESNAMICKGEILWNDDKTHVGIYIANGMCCECNTTPTRDVHLIPVAQSKFTHHGFADWIEYTAL